MNSNDTKQKILNAAEELFASQGFSKTTTREITYKANVNVAAVNYYFDSKELLVQAVIERRLSDLNNERILQLQAVREKAVDKNLRPQTEDILRAFVLPLFQLRASEPKASLVLGLVGRSFFTAEEPVRSIFLQSFNPVFNIFSQCLEEALPHISKQDVLSRSKLVVGTVGSALYWSEDPVAFDQSLTREAVGPEMSVDILLRFLTAGLEASPED
jgi:AcrR family transcriptional regulator